MTHASHPFAGGPARAVVAIVPRADRLLVIRRSQLVRAPGNWCFPGGSLEQGENEPTAIRREMFEELAVASQPLRCVWRSESEWGIEIAWWLCRLAPDTQPIAQPDEVAELAWLTYAEVTELDPLLSSNQEFLAAYAAREISLDVW